MLLKNSKKNYILPKSTLFENFNYIYSLIYLKTYKNNIFFIILSKNRAYFSSIGQLKSIQKRVSTASVFQKMFSKIVYYLKKWFVKSVLLQSNSLWFYKNSIIIALFKNLKLYNIQILAYYFKSNIPHNGCRSKLNLQIKYF